ncbi:MULTISPECIES: GNAT family N-acetyltransferase [unclassified Pseudoalteromonas]|uniref:GNAT family N-acetyltransferase n=1 Tax=unclassified Pseudoalteromonas TaxID=194690 RepID=UPI0038681F83
MNIVFKTNRLLLRHANASDAAVLLKLVNQADFIKYIGDKAIYTLDDAKDYIEQSFIAAHKNQGFGPYIITLYNDVIVGVVGLYKRSAIQYPDLGYALVSGFEKKGYIFEAANVLVQNIHKLGVTQLSAITSTNNMASQNVLAKLGFSKVGVAVINNDKTAVNVFLLNNQSSG